MERCADDQKLTMLRFVVYYLPPESWGTVISLQVSCKARSSTADRYGKRFRLRVELDQSALSCFESGHAGEVLLFEGRFKNGRKVTIPRCGFACFLACLFLCFARAQVTSFHKQDGSLRTPHNLVVRKARSSCSKSIK